MLSGCFVGGAKIQSEYASRDSYQLSGYIKVGESGKYTFSLADGAKGILRIHKINVLDTDSNEAYPNDNKLNLGAGLHPFTLYLRDEPASQNVIQWKAKEAGEFKAIPASNFSH